MKDLLTQPSFLRAADLHQAAVQMAGEVDARIADRLDRLTVASPRRHNVIGWHSEESARARVSVNRTLAAGGPPSTVVPPAVGCGTPEWEGPEKRAAHEPVIHYVPDTRGITHPRTNTAASWLEPLGPTIPEKVARQSARDLAAHQRDMERARDHGFETRVVEAIAGILSSVTPERAVHLLGRVHARLMALTSAALATAAGEVSRG
jgi:hypothetical protein